LFTLIAAAAQSEAPVVIYGESGAGKELVAAAIHRLSHRHKGPFIKVNSAALNESLLESELFGHVKGAFTGADRTRVGRFEAAHGGDIFLDEIGDLPLATQAKLLRVLQEKVIEKVGDHAPIPVDVRVITATNKDLHRLMAQGRFREDLFYRIGVIPIHLPPLRERPEDIPLLVDHFIKKYSQKANREVVDISSKALKLLAAYPWPGNVRELEHTIERIVILEDGEVIQPEHLPSFITQRPGELLQLLQEGGSTLEEMERRLIEAVLQRTRGRRQEAAQILGINRKTLLAKIKKYHLPGHYSD
jgi:transcriptional regulator with PAS, ATPase and Fis domain